MELLLTSATFTLVFVVILAVLSVRNRETERKQFIEERIAPHEVGAEIDITRKNRLAESPVRSFFRRLNVLRRLEKDMWQAGIYSSVSDVLLIVVLLFGAGGAGGQAFWGDPWFALGSGIAMGAMPILYIRFRRQRRLKAFSAQLPFALDLIKSSLEAGHSLPRGLQVMVKEFGDPLGGEFRTALEQTRIGLPLGRALEEMLQRVPEEDLKLLVVAVKVQSEVGSSLANIVGRLSEIVRIRQRLRLQIRALTAQSRMGGLVVGLLPVFILIIFSVIQPNYTHILFYTPSGQKILKTAAGLDLAALITIRRLLRLDY
jgi:tight adherence protein B